MIEAARFFLFIGFFVFYFLLSVGFAIVITITTDSGYHHSDFSLLRPASRSDCEENLPPHE
jgi:hypothetical protein